MASAIKSLAYQFHAKPPLCHVLCFLIPLYLYKYQHTSVATCNSSRPPNVSQNSSSFNPWSNQTPFSTQVEACFGRIQLPLFSYQNIGTLLFTVFAVVESIAGRC